MCSIVGWNGLFDPELVGRICFNSRIRGLHSFGYSYVVSGKVKVKKFLDYDKFLGSLTLDKPNKFIAHFRYSTSGDYKNQQNNQPVLRHNESMVFNGVLDMRTKEEMEMFYSVKMETENDGELALIKKTISDLDFIEITKGKTFAGAFIDSKQNIKVFRNLKRPAYIGKKNGAKILASTADILTRSGVLEMESLAPNNITEL